MVELESGFVLGFFSNGLLIWIWSHTSHYIGVYAKEKGFIGVYAKKNYLALFLRRLRFFLVRLCFRLEVLCVIA